ncbi:MAG: DUF2911 domain-containing protein [Gemmatimonadaceae bacterium]
MRTQLFLASLAIPFASVVALAQPATMVYRLGPDTLAVEQYTHANNRITGEMVVRVPGPVARVKYDVAVGADGRPMTAIITRMQADGSPPVAGAREYRIRITADSAYRETVFADSTSRVALAVKKAMINFPVYVYGPSELLSALKKGGTPMDSVPAIGVGGGVQFTGLAAMKGDTVHLVGPAYAMNMRFDAKNQLLLVDGKFTTNKAYATRANGTVDIAAIAKSMKPSGVLSVRDFARASFGPGGMVDIDYGRPMVRDRTVWGGLLIPFDSVWRAGANDATHMFTTRELTIGDMKLKAGMYTLWVQHTHNGTFLIVNSQVGQWGTQYNASRDIGRVAMQMTPATAPVEEFTISIRPQGNRGVIEMAWGPMVASVPFTVSGAQP